MAIPRNSLRSFLVYAKDTLRTAIDKRQKVTLVIGNESADLDSLTSSLLYAYIRSSTPTPNAFTPLYIPITNIPFRDIHLRPEFQALLPHSNLEPQHLITLDDLPDIQSIKSELQPENTKWILVDHNALQGQLGAIYHDRIGGVIDHHEDEHKVSEDTDDEPRLITKSGSCTSLVTNYCREAWDSLSSASLSTGAAHAQGDEVVDDGAVARTWDAQVAQLALASILIDTANLTDRAKVTQHDTRAVEYLEAKIMASPQAAVRYDRAKFYKEIDAAKKDVGRLKLHDILRKDYKEWDESGTKLGISSVVKPIEFLVQKAADEAGSDEKSHEAFASALRAFAADRSLGIYAIMTTSTSSEGEFQRELLVWALSAQTASAARKFAKSAAEELGLTEWDGPSDQLDEEGGEQWRKVWRQRNVQHSRKRVAPLLREAMR